MATSVPIVEIAKKSRKCRKCGAPLKGHNREKCINTPVTREVLPIIRHISESAPSCTETTKVRGGALCSYNGNKYETHVAQQCAQYRFNNIPICADPRHAGNGHGCDIILQDGAHQFGLEVKNARATDCGQRTLVISDDSLRLTIRDGENCDIHRRYMENFIPFNGEIPKFLAAKNMTERHNAWNSEKTAFHDEIFAIESRSAVREYYSRAGSLYIQIEKHGLYRTTNDDPLRTCAPLLDVGAKIRIRCKRHGCKGDPPRSIQASIVMIKKGLIASPVSLGDPSKIPRSFTCVTQTENLLSPSADR